MEGHSISRERGGEGGAGGEEESEGEVVGRAAAETHEGEVTEALDGLAEGRVGLDELVVEEDAVVEARAMVQELVSIRNAIAANLKEMAD